MIEMSEARLKGDRCQSSSGHFPAQTSQGYTQNTSISITVKGKRKTATQFRFASL